MSTVIQRKSKGGRVTIGNVSVKKPALDQTKIVGSSSAILKVTNPS